MQFMKVFDNDEPNKHSWKIMDGCDFKNCSHIFPTQQRDIQNLLRYWEREMQSIEERCPYYEKKKVAFICVHNSCRSQIAEALEMIEEKILEMKKKHTIRSILTEDDLII